jgi:hypothetical protein
MTMYNIDVCMKLKLNAFLMEREYIYAKEILLSKSIYT